MRTLLMPAMLVHWFVWVSSAAPVSLHNGSLEVTVDSEFPRILQYRLKSNGATIAGQSEPVATVMLNGAQEPCLVSFNPKGRDAAVYSLSFPRHNVQAKLRLSLLEEGVELRVTEVREGGALRVKSFAFPGNCLLSLSGAGPRDEFAMVRAWGYNNVQEQMGPVSQAKPGAGTANYFFLSTGSIAAGIAGNHIEDCARVAVTMTESNGVKSCAAQNPVWQYREIDGEPLPLPWVRVLVCGDRNGDSKADWQDAALLCRAALPEPFGAEHVRVSVADQIAMDFASGAQQPFLRILDNVKKVNLMTDGLGQSVLIKGYTAEGHDSANTDYGGHYNSRAGGLTDLNFVLGRFRDYNARCGVHINATEVYPEAHRYKPEILQRDRDGNPVGGWYWLDHSHLIDKRKDLLSGNLFTSLEQMRRELPDLDFVYVDVYGDSGWNAWKLAHKLNGMGLPIHTEYSSVFDPWSVWAHNRSFKSRIFRFIWNSDRDLCDPDPLLRGADHVGFMGWQGERDIAAFLRNTFARNLPTKFLQHFPLLLWETNRAVFGGGIEVVKSGDSVACSQNGRIVMTWTGKGSNNRIFVPWDPLKAGKIYVWDDVGTEMSWQLPPSWQNKREVFLYRLTDRGRTEERILHVAGSGKTLNFTVNKGTPYVIYPSRAPAQKAPAWGEGGFVRDPGFDSHSFDSWMPGSPSGDCRIENDSHGNSRLVVAGAGGAGMTFSQRVTGLRGGATYAASVWVQVKGERLASIILQPKGASPVSNYVHHTSVRHSAPNDPRTGSNYQRVKVVFAMPLDSTTATLMLGVGSGGTNSSVEFDDVRIVETRRSPEASLHWFFEDFENVDMGYGPFTCCPDEHTHLAEANPPYTQDVIRGKFSLKSRERNGLIVRTLPATLRFKPNTRYRMTCETMGNGHFTVVSEGANVLELKFPEKHGRVSGDFITGNDPDSFIMLFKDGGDAIVIDDLAIDDLGAAEK